MKNSITKTIKNFYENDSASSHSSKSCKKSPTLWQDLTKEEQKLVKTYFTLSPKASKLKKLVQSECETDLRNAEHYHEWQKICAQRNETAHQLKFLLAKKKKRGVFKEKALYYIET